MSSLADLSPSSLWHWFEEICAIPHPSKHEHNLSAHIVRWAAEKGISCRQDPTGNLILKKPATSGMSDRKGVVLQAHLDMVPQKTADKTFDFTLDAIHAYIEGDWVTADGTTLGADNGIGLASTLAILGSSDIPHGPLEALLTVDEETGMTGAFGLAPNELDADILINTDSEQEGEIYMGCAGGESATITLSLDRQPPLASSSGKTYEVVISGLKGGHSGCDIHLGRANANKLLGRFLFEASGALNLQLCEVQGGSLPNAIPRDARATFVIAEEQKIALERQLADFQTVVQIELEQVEAAIKFELNPVDKSLSPLTSTSQNILIALLQSLPDGVARMSDVMTDVVETSCNLGVVSTDEESASLLVLIRSLTDSCRKHLANQIRALSILAGAECVIDGAYPGWTPDPDSPIMHLARDTYTALYNKTPNIMVIHAGLECGLFKQPYPNIDMLSIGPTIRHPHSPDEKVDINSVERYWRFLIALLANIPKKGGST